MSYKCKEDITPQEGKQTMLLSMIANQEVDFVLSGGSRFGGKSEILSMIPLLFAHDPLYRGIFFRRSYDEIMGANGLWQKAQNQYRFFDAIPNKTDKSWTFPSGAIQEYRHMYNDGDEESHRGKGYSMVGFDEIDQFSPEMVQMLMTCLRSEANMDSFMIGTLNPHPDSWCLPLVEYYLTPDGFPDPEKCGEIRWYVIKDNEFLFGESEEWFKENHPECVYVNNPAFEEPVYVRPKRFTYVFFNIFDNPIGLANNTAYLSELNNLPEHDRMTQLYGNWYAREKGENYFKREWLKIADEVPTDAKCVRAWDKGYSDDEKKRDPTASIKMYKDSVGNYYIAGEFDERLHNEFRQGQDVIYGRFHKLVGQRDEWMLLQAIEDGEDCVVVHPQENGAGKGECEQLTKMFLEAGFKVKTIPVGNVKGAKLKKFIPFCSAAQNGFVYIVPTSFPNTATYNAYLKELENFNGERSSASNHDEWVDTTSDAYASLKKERVTKSFVLPSTTSSSMLATANIGY